MNALAVADAPVLTDDSSLVRRFLAWAQQASSFERADAVNALARAYLYSHLSPEARADAEIALIRALDDPEIRVRRALAEAFASAREAPRALILTLARDVSSVARVILAHSPLLRDADLVDCVAYGDEIAQTAVARRALVSAPLAAAIAEVGEIGALLALTGNAGAQIGPAALWRLFERFPGNIELRARLVDRPALPAALRAAIAAEAAKEGAADIPDPRRAEHIARELREQAFVAIADGCAPAELTELVAWLSARKHLTVGLMFRALACGGAALFAASLGEMAGMPAPRAAALARDPRSHGFAALYRRAQMPAHLLPAFRIAAGRAVQGGPALVVDMLRAIEALADPALASIEALLWRLAAEAARTEAREAVALQLAAPEPEPEPVLVEAEAPPVLMLNVEAGNENHAPPVVIDMPALERSILAA